MNNRQFIDFMIIEKTSGNMDILKSCACKMFLIISTLKKQQAPGAACLWIFIAAKIQATLD